MIFKNKILLNIKMSYSIAIPSYKRAKILNEKTLKTLSDAGIKKERINVFIVEEDLEKYKEELNPEFFNELVVGKKGLIQQREFAEHFYEVGSHLIFIDDDLEKIDLALTNYTSLDEFFQDAFKECISRGSFIWGIHPCDYAFFRNSNKEITDNLKYIVGCLYGIINRRLEELTPKITIEFNSNKEDFERTLLYYFKDGKTLRFNRIGATTKYYGKDGGGLGTKDDRQELNKSATIKLNEAFPDNTTIRVRGEGARRPGQYELRFKKGKAKK
jgi:hypothetical protein